MFPEAQNKFREPSPPSISIFSRTSPGLKERKRTLSNDREACPSTSPDVRSVLHKRSNAFNKDELDEKKKVSFLPMAFVVLIPTNDEYHKAGLGPDLWWNEQDYKSFKRGALQDLQTFLLKNPEMEPKAAVKLYFNHVEDGRQLSSPLRSHLHPMPPTVSLAPLNDSKQCAFVNDKTPCSRSAEKIDDRINEPVMESKGQVPSKLSLPPINMRSSAVASSPPSSNNNGAFEMFDIFSKFANMFNSE